MHIVGNLIIDGGIDMGKYNDATNKPIKLQKSDVDLLSKSKLWAMNQN